MDHLRGTFQSAPGFGAGGNVIAEEADMMSLKFQSAPGFGAGGNILP